jgi:hypothetical protein
MPFTPKQVQELKKDVERRYVRSRQVNGRELSYIEGWHAMSEANRIFGFDCWNRETLDAKCVLSRETRGSYLTVYTVKVRVTVRANNQMVVREGHGTGEGRGSSPGEAHDFGLKAAETDATKRALATFGRPFGLGLYGAATSPRPKVGDENWPSPVSTGVVLPPDNTTPIPRPSRYFGRPQDVITRDRRAGPEQLALPASAEAPLAPTSPEHEPGKIDKSVLAIGTPRRFRDKAHLRFVASHPCLVCGRQPADAHHIQFAQPRAMGLKVSDEFTVPLCRTHHRELHQAGNEKNWWRQRNIGPLEIAERLWRESRTKLFPAIDENR